MIDGNCRRACRTMRVPLAMVSLFAGLLAHAEAPVAAQSLTDREQRELQSAEALGLRMFQHDRAAWKATDAVTELPGFVNDSRLRGWITEERGDQIDVTFIGAADDETVALYRVTVKRDSGLVENVSALPSPVPLTEFEMGAAAAVKSAREFKFSLCAPNYNTVTLPTEGEGSKKWLVYLMPGTSEQGTIPIGGSYRLTIDWDSHAVSSSRAFTKSCLAVKNDPASEAIFVTHLLDNIPTEVHVFWSLWAGKAMYVGTPDNRIWAIEGGRIRLADRPAAGD